MKTARWVLLGAATFAVLAFAALLRARLMPLGVEGEWTWQRVRFPPRPLDVGLAAMGVVGFALFAAAGMHALRGNARRRREVAWVAALFLASIAAQVVVQSGGPDGHGLSKWSTLAIPGSSGYFKVAKAEMSDLRNFWADYPRWIRDQDALHIGTHPPGLFLISRALLSLMEKSPSSASRVASMTPATVDSGLAAILGPIPRPEKSAIVLMGALTLLACSATVIPIYLLARSTLTPSLAFAAACLWPIAPSPILFQPTADTAFPALAAAALALAAYRGLAGAALTGVALAFGMQCTLAFLPVGLAVAIVQLWQPDVSWRRRAARVLATGVGFLGCTGLFWAASGANPFTIWWVNQTNHARFYRENPRSYLAWVIANPIELATAIGFPTAIAAIAAFAWRSAPRSAWAVLIILALLNVSGKNLSEVGRLWLMFMPGLCVAAAGTLSRNRVRPPDLAFLIALLGLQTLVLQSMIQVVYPF